MLFRSVRAVEFLIFEKYNGVMEKLNILSIKLTYHDHAIGRDNLFSANIWKMVVFVKK